MKFAVCIKMMSFKGLIMDHTLYILVVLVIVGIGVLSIPPYKFGKRLYYYF